MPCAARTFLGVATATVCPAPDEGPRSVLRCCASRYRYLRTIRTQGRAHSTGPGRLMLDRQLLNRPATPTHGPAQIRVAKTRADIKRRKRTPDLAPIAAVPRLPAPPWGSESAAPMVEHSRRCVETTRAMEHARHPPVQIGDRRPAAGRCTSARLSLRQRYVQVGAAPYRRGRPVMDRLRSAALGAVDVLPDGARRRRASSAAAA